MIYQKIKDNIKYISRKYFQYDLSTIRTKLDQDFFDQKNLLSSAQVKTIFDVGSHIGQTTRKYKKLYPKANIHGFEPYPEIYKKYIDSTCGDKKIYSNNFALSDKNGEAKFFVNNFHGTNSLLSNNKEYTDAIDSYKPLKTMRVKTETLDDYCKKNKIEKINILKMDVQGGELLVLKGSKKMLSEGKIDLIYTEVEYARIYKNQPLFKDLEIFLKQYNYSLYKTYNLAYLDDNTPLAGDAIFIHNGIKNKL
ncbi:FkbM family methyltransferase [Patescibacteria group bacterium]|nr:FkbM family methyltransferase [Candidatus Falkowbacteria bacterium]MBU3906155.1 FkbM family methyltransferase [Patescibacteria group bacterium]MCG2697515.1 FkbM family methyltransferase [Candidatus Parcubacteria bacterium]MBU4014682.1 FkbM family methyltransferase [Patescibacteria group bacterium]MBU4026648.1 FkbM family methyltransferase [Patescibacteria group bacterium]